MRLNALGGLAQSDLVGNMAAYPAGRVSLWLLNQEKPCPQPAARVINHLVNLLGLRQPFEVALAPMLVLEIRHGEK